MTYPIPDLDDLAEAHSRGKGCACNRRNCAGRAGAGIGRPCAFGVAVWSSLVVVPHVAEAARSGCGSRDTGPRATGRCDPRRKEPRRTRVPSRRWRPDSRLVRLLARLDAGEVQVLVAPARVLLAPIPDPAMAASRTLHSSGDLGWILMISAAGSPRRVSVA